MTKKVFISFPMSGKTFEEIVEERDNILKKIKEKFSSQIDVELINSIYECPFEHKPLWYLGWSIQAMSEADIAVFSGNNSNEDLESIKSLCESRGYNILAYADNLRNFDPVASYDE